MRKILVVAVLLLGGCAGVSDDANSARGRVQELLAKPLGPAEAAQVAILNNPGRQASDAELHTRKAWFEAVAARETVRYMAQVKEASEVSAELARRMTAVGNFSGLAQAREQAFHADTAVRLARARHDATAARERLARLMGLRNADPAFELPERLPELPSAMRTGGESDSAYRTAFDIARYYRDEIVPLRKRISEEVLLRYNGMLVSVFELLADSREQTAAVTAYIEALRDFWLADADLQMALGAKELQ
jgi:outer membrane protein TolC